HYDAADDIGMAVEILGRRMHNHVESELKWTLHVRTRKRVVRDGHGTKSASDFGDLLEVDELEHRVGRRLDPDEPGTRRRSCADVFRIAHIYVTECEAGGTASDAIEKAKGAAVHVIGGDDVVACVEAIEQRGGGGQTRGERKTAFARFESRNTTLPCKT